MITPIYPSLAIWGRGANSVTTTGNTGILTGQIFYIDMEWPRWHVRLARWILSKWPRLIRWNRLMRVANAYIVQSVKDTTITLDGPIR